MDALKVNKFREGNPNGWISYDEFDLLKEMEESTNIMRQTVMTSYDRLEQMIREGT